MQSVTSVKSEGEGTSAGSDGKGRESDGNQLQSLMSVKSEGEGMSAGSDGNQLTTKRARLAP